MFVCCNPRTRNGPIRYRNRLQNFGRTPPDRLYKTGRIRDKSLIEPCKALNPATWSDLP